MDAWQYNSSTSRDLFVQSPAILQHHPTKIIVQVFNTPNEIYKTLPASIDRLPTSATLFYKALVAILADLPY